MRSWPSRPSGSEPPSSIFTRTSCRVSRRGSRDRSSRALPAPPKSAACSSTRSCERTRPPICRTRVPASCVFCQIARGEVPSHVVHRDEDVIAFLDRAPLPLGHVLVMPTAHGAPLHYLPNPLYAPLSHPLHPPALTAQTA